MGRGPAKHDVPQAHVAHATAGGRGSAASGTADKGAPESPGSASGAGGAAETARQPRRISVKLQLDLAGGARIGPGKIRLLELIEQEGSLSRAAEAMRVSYRRAWLFVQQINKAFEEPAVSTPEHGHGGSAARLTEFGRELIRHYRAMEATAAAQNTDSLRWLASHQKR